MSSILGSFFFSILSEFSVWDMFFLEWIFCFFFLGGGGDFYIFFFGCSSQGVPSNTGCVQVMLAPVENSIHFSGV